ncbi:putative lipid II flippase FtsW [Xanthomonas campestris pv. campestris]|uniref:putative lipid II flippase FtsW n=1 Tax=Xanthomonas campestris TaxID=339 RepID=UPI000838DED0|nr:putative lipid II flippase FtsW [Xanthomonas campestris]MCC3252827.1 putative lipid II flippase FtsW [Xanthomonas campestris pv. armoraciae]MCD0249429.1 putative lipid II flippase FtsW [Xanthomonas campestris pv. campestris]MCD0256120.1 putative lipid II flippase FtsW [Xanthomonas campestris pv. campestris]MCD0261598.1 putative lipid II flippase FtsW [Xanthomonas campestris pv. campestris]MCD0269782.1 putative lipid II flippase FtsW [Xanthomonas campestris pv. campestris]
MNDMSRQATRLDAIGGRYDPWLLSAAATLASLGVVMVASSSIELSENPFYYLTRHLLFLGIGVGLAFWAMRTELKTIEQYNQVLLLACFGLLMVVFVPGLGSSVNGAKRWINLGVSKFQTVEAVKVLYIVWLSSYLVRFRDEVNATWPAMLKPLGVAIALVGLLLMQPDFGSSTLLLAITAGMLVLGGVNLPRMSMPIVFGLPVFAFIAILEPYRLRRITSFLDPWADQLGSGYQLSNALMAVGRGQWTGVGLGASVQKLNYLPEAHTDFIFSVIAEELGFVGVCSVVALYALLVGRAFWLGMRCVEMKRHFSGYIAFGIGLWISLQSFVSVGVNLGILPTKGLTLPLISSGGSSVLMTCVAMGLLLRVSYEMDRAERLRSKLSPHGAAPAPMAPAEPSAEPAPAPAPAPVRKPQRETAAAAPAPVMPASVAPASAVLRGTSRMQPRVEPTFGRIA